MIDTVENNNTAADVTRSIGLESTGNGTYQSLKRHADRLGINIPMGFKLPSTDWNKIDVDEMFIKSVRLVERQLRGSYSVKE